MKTALALAVALATLAVPAAAAPPSTPAEVCALLTAAEVREVLGKAARAEPGGLDLTGPSCTWAEGRALLTVAVETDASLAKASSSANGQTVDQRFKVMLGEVAAKRAVEVKGVGVQAVWQSNLLWVRTRAALFTVAVNRDGLLPADDLPHARAAALHVAAKL